MCIGLTSPYIGLMNLLNILILLSITIGLLILLGLLVKHWSKSKTAQVRKSEQPQSVANPYQALRRQALQIPATFFANSPSAEPVYGIIMDWHVGEGSITLTCFVTGESSVYFSNGGGIIGGQASEQAMQAAQRYLQEANQAYVSATPMAAIDLPLPNTVQFYFLTKEGRRFHSVAMQYLEDRSSPMLTLFEQANDLLTALRELQEKGASENY